MANTAPKTHPARKGRRPKRKERQTDPVILVMERGLNIEKRRKPILDEDGKDTGSYEMADAVVPKGLVLGPVQTMVLAKYIQQLNATVEMALSDDADEEQEQEEGDETT